jgi:hypothetical protein
LAVGSWQLAVGSWQLAENFVLEFWVAKKQNYLKELPTY